MLTKPSALPSSVGVLVLDVNELVVAEVDNKCALIQKIGDCLCCLLLHE